MLTVFLVNVFQASTSEPRVYPRLQSWWRALVQCRGTKLIEARKLSRCTKLYCLQMRVSGFNNVLKTVLKAVLKAKSVTNNLPILSVLAAAFI
jgi:hypothetical protein